MKETFIPILVLIIVYLVLSLNHKKESFEASQRYKKRAQSINSSEVLNPEINPRIYKIARSLIKKVNSDLKVNYQMGKFDNVIEDSDNEGNPRYVMDFFVYQINQQQVNDVNRRLIADVTVYVDKNQLQINTLNFSNAIKDQGPQYLPLNDDDTNKLIIKPSLTGQDYNPSGGPHLKSWRGSLEYNTFDSPAGMKSDPDDGEFQNTILPLQIQELKNKRVFPCQDYGDWWDANGVPFTQAEENGLKKLNLKCSQNLKSELKGETNAALPKESDQCYGSYNTATSPRTVVGNYYTNSLESPSTRPDQEYDWLFTAERHITGYPHAGAFGTGR